MRPERAALVPFCGFWPSMEKSVRSENHTACQFVFQVHLSCVQVQGEDITGHRSVAFPVKANSYSTCKLQPSNIEKGEIDDNLTQILYFSFTSKLYNCCINISVFKYKAILTT